MSAQIAFDTPITVRDIQNLSANDLLRRMLVDGDELTRLLGEKFEQALIEIDNRVIDVENEVDSLERDNSQLLNERNISEEQCDELDDLLHQATALLSEIEETFGLDEGMDLDMKEQLHYVLSAIVNNEAAGNWRFNP